MQQPHTLSYDKYEAAAYTAVRLIPSYAAVYNVLSQLKTRVPDFEPTSMLDFGCGPGTAIWASRELFKIDQVTAIDASEPMLQILKDLALNLEIPNLATQRYLSIAKQEDLQSDLVVSSFCLSELPNDSIRKTTVLNLWRQTKDTLVLIDRGTPIGATLVATARQLILDAEKDTVYVVAPCPHELVCPMLTNRHGHWCHFSQKYQLDDHMVFIRNSRGI